MMLMQLKKAECAKGVLQGNQFLDVGGL